ncbi:MAG: Flp family type IVb pilin [Desulfosoma sp.]
MPAICKRLSKFRHTEQGATAPEYAIIASSIAAAVALAVKGLGTKVNALFSNFYDLLISLIK